MFNSWLEESKKRNLQEKEDAISLVAHLLTENGITCKKCGGIAVPNCETTNKYICIDCEDRFVNTKHNMTNKLSYYKILQTYKNGVDPENVMKFYYLALERLRSNKPL